jgi:hypothetical protein
MAEIAENLLVMVLSVIILIGGIFLLLLLADMWLKFKSGSREQDGLADLLIAARTETLTKPQGTNEDPPPNGEDAHLTNGS